MPPYDIAHCAFDLVINKCNRLSGKLDSVVKWLEHETYKPYFGIRTPRDVMFFVITFFTIFRLFVHSFSLYFNTKFSQHF